VALDKNVFLAALAAFGTFACDTAGTKCGGDSGLTDGCSDSGLTGTGETPTTPTTPTSGTNEGTYGYSGYSYGYSYSSSSYSYSYSGN
jgi:hypothetical protein